ncbi:MAG: ABC transporter permease [Candidatus Cyclobacteriaceae bacterium M2_1C_046]
MIKNYLKITFRNLLKNKVFVIVNILGMGTAIACCIVAYLNWDYNVNFDSDIEKASEIYRVDVYRDQGDEERLYGFSPLPLGDVLRENFGIDQVVRFTSSGANFRIKDEVFNTGVSLVEEDFFKLFNFNFLSGNPDEIADKGKIFISDELAKKYYGSEDPVGKIMTALLNDGSKDYLIAGVYEKKPTNSSFGGRDAYANFQNLFDVNKDLKQDDWSAWTTTFIRLENPSAISGIEQQLLNYVDIQNKARLDFKINRYYIEPFEGMAIRASKNEMQGHWLQSSMPPPAVIVPAVMAILILLIACFNFTNTSIAISSKRLKEIGIRKVMGGLRQQLIIQFMLENIFLCFLSLIMGLIIAAFLIPAYSNLWPFLDLKYSLLGNVGFFIFLTILLLFIGLIAGSYPAFYISKYEPASILKGTLKLGGTNKLTSSLLTLQFSISLIAIILGIIFYQNAIYQEELDYGFSRDGTISVAFQNEDEVRSFQNLIDQDVRIKSIAASEHQINRSYRNDPLESESKKFDADILHIGENYLNTLNFTLLEGRSFRENSETDYLESALVSEELVRVFGWDDPIGKKLIWMDTVPLYVIGVIKDVYLSGTWAPVKPLMLRYTAPDNYRFITAKVAPSDILAVNEALEGHWRTLFPDRLYTGSIMDEDMSGSANVNNNILKLFGFLGVVATLLSAIGLFSLMSLSILRRMKEIGVRKVHGASTANLFGILNKNFVIILLIASVLGSILSYFMADKLMGSIWAYYVNPNIIAFGIAVLILFVIAGATVSLKVYRAASANPVNTLRSE